MKSISTRDEFTTTPLNATIPNMLIILIFIPSNKCPIIAPTNPKGMALITINGWKKLLKGIAKSP